MLNLDVTLRRHGGDSGAASAYSAYIEGRGFLAPRSAGQYRPRHRQFFDRVKQDPKYALAYAGLAKRTGAGPRSRGQQAAVLANQNAEYAVQLDPKWPWALGAGSVYLDADRPPMLFGNFKKRWRSRR